MRKYKKGRRERERGRERGTSGSGVCKGEGVAEGGDAEREGEDLVGLSVLDSVAPIIGLVNSVAEK